MVSGRSFLLPTKQGSVRRRFLRRLCPRCRIKKKVKSQKAKGKSQKSEDTEPRPLTPDPQGEAEACFLKAIKIAQHQQAKSLELRATMSLVRLQQLQAAQVALRTTQDAARTMLDAEHNMLSSICSWFTEGFDTKDLQEAKALLDSLGSSVKKVET
jgi:hypothetical protein